MNYDFIFTEKRDFKYVKTFEYFIPKKEEDIKVDTEENKEEVFNPFSHVDKSLYTGKKDELLHITTGNKKLKFPFLSLPAGYSCPAAKDCKSIATRHGNKFSDGKGIKDFGEFRCYSASAEVQYENVRAIRWKNYDLLLKCKNNKEQMVDLIDKSLNYSIVNDGIFGVFRIHADGDFFTQTYFDAWLEVVKKYPKVNFYAYTKSLPFWIRRINEIPNNLNLIASYGGKFDDLIEKNNLRNAVVVDSVEDAVKLKRKIDIDDSLAYGTTENFALLLHGSQKEKTEKSKQSYKNRDVINNIKNK